MNDFSINTQNIHDISIFKKFLYNYIYNNESNMMILTNFINKNIETFNISYDINAKSIEIKLKKTNLKKGPNFKHDTYFYNDIVSIILVLFFNYPDIQNSINQALQISELDELEKNIICNIYSLIKSTTMISHMYKITPILDNVIIIYL